MKASELAELEREYEVRGYRVVLLNHWPGLEGGGQPEIIETDVTPDEGETWPTLEQAQAVAERLKRLAKWQHYRGVRILDPDGEDVTSPFPPPLASAPAAVPASPPPVADVPPSTDLAGILTVLASSDELGKAIVGDQRGSVVMYPTQKVEELRAEGRIGGPPSYTTFSSMLIGERALEFQPVNGGPGLTPVVAFWPGDDGNGVWFVQHPVQEA